MREKRCIPYPASKGHDKPTVNSNVQSLLLYSQYQHLIDATARAYRQGNGEKELSDPETPPQTRGLRVLLYTRQKKTNKKKQKKKQKMMGLDWICLL
jgi:hypothetical protein